MICLLKERGVGVVTRLHQRRTADFRRGKRLGPGDDVLEWLWPSRPDLALMELHCQRLARHRVGHRPKRVRRCCEASLSIALGRPRRLTTAARELTRPAGAANRTPGELALCARESSGKDGRPVTSWPRIAGWALAAYSRKLKPAT